jgi:hypothetical protein
MKHSLLICCIFVFSFSVNAQTLQLDPLAKSYFTQNQIDTMSQKFIKFQNYIVRYSWTIYKRWDKDHDTIVSFNRDTIDIRPYLISRNEFSPTYIYDVYPGLVIVLDSKEAVRYKYIEIYSAN